MTGRQVLEREKLQEQLILMHLQWFAAEDEGRTEDPTEHKIKKAREEGRVPKSQDLTATIVLLLTTIGLGIFGAWLLETMANMLRFFLSQSTQYDPVNDRGIMQAFISWFFQLSMPLLLVAMLGGFLGDFMQVGFKFTTKPLKPDFKRIMPKFGEYIKRSILGTEAIYNLGKSFVKIGILVVIVFINIQGNLNLLLNLNKRTVLAGVGFVSGLVWQVLLQSSIALLALALFDWWFQRRQFKESLKMTKQEIKEERKSYEGDPLVRNRLKQRMREILNQNMIRNVPKADVVITNPTHYAVAMEYKKDSMQAPTVIAKGQDLIAQRIKEVARENGIAIIENKPLARALFAEVEIGDVIPDRFYEAVVVVLKEVYRIKRREREAV